MWYRIWCQCFIVIKREYFLYGRIKGIRRTLELEETPKEARPEINRINQNEKAK
jgi:hypothetical protein